MHIVRAQDHARHMLKRLRCLVIFESSRLLSFTFCIGARRQRSGLVTGGRRLSRPFSVCAELRTEDTGKSANANSNIVGHH
jgi:hypothetical protein